jgi:hypothetical protein
MNIVDYLEKKNWTLCEACSILAWVLPYSKVMTSEETQRYNKVRTAFLKLHSFGQLKHFYDKDKLVMFNAVYLIKKLQKEEFEIPEAVLTVLDG